MALSDLKTLINATSQNLSQYKGLTAAYNYLGLGVPTIDGYTTLIGTNNSTNFGSNSSVVFNDENIYINTMNALYQGNATAKAAFDSLVGGGASIQDKLIAVYQSIIPAAQQSAAGQAYFISQAAFFTARAAELGIPGTTGAALVGAATLIKIAVDNDIGGLGDGINDLYAAIGNGSAAIPQSGSTFTALETADGTQFDGDDSGGTAGQTFTLTTGVDQGAAFTGTSGNDTFTAADIGTDPTFTIGDTLNGAGGNDTLNIVTADAFAGVPVAASVSSIETVNVTSGEKVTIDTSTGFAGLTKLTATATGTATTTGGADITAAGTTAIEITSTGGAFGVDAIAVNGGSSVSVIAKNNVSDTIAVGATTAPTGAVTVTSTGGTTDGDSAGTIAVTGGTTVSITQLAGNAAANGNNTTGGAITVNGNASTTSVTVTQSKTAIGATATATTPGVVGFTAGAVTITDANAASATAAGTIETVSITNAGAAAVNSGALKTLNLGGTLTTVDAGTLGALTTPANTALGLNLNEAKSTGAVTIDSDIKTLNIASSTKASTLASLVANGATTVNVTGDAALTLTAQTLGAVTAINVTNTAGASFGTALATGVTFTGGTGADTITLTDEFTKAITMGAGNDKVTIVDADIDGVLAGTGGSVHFGDGTDTIVLTAATANAVDDNATFNSKFTGFEVLDIATGATTSTVNLAGVGGVNNVVTRGVGAGQTLTIDGFATNGRLTLDAATGGGGIVANVANAALTAGDSFNLALSNGTGAAVAFGSVTLGGVDTIRVTTTDAGTGANTAATVDMLTLNGTADTTTLTVAGNDGLTLTNTSLIGVTSFDASGVVANGTDDTAANLAVTYTSANATATAIVSITGGAGNDVLTGKAAKDTITGSGGADIVSGGLGQDTITVGNGHDIIRLASNSDATVAFNDSTAAAADIIHNFGLVSATAVTYADAAAFQAATTAGVNANVLSIDFTKDDGGAGSGINLAVAIEADTTGTGQAAGVTYTVKDGILTLSGAGASTVDTLGEWLTEAAAVSATAGEVVAFVFGSDTYVFGENGAQDILVDLVGVQATSLKLATAASSAATGAVLIGDGF